ncbi:MAG: site-specific DNA-methyltransferase [Oscillospiraceae bacterium]|jgi:hypothetical protein|nr:site-specific DNA-methyltransferase [Oscillospiraceae bacterium]
MREVRCSREVHEGTGPGGELWQAPLSVCAGDLLAVHAGRVQLVYIDPPFFTGQRFHMRMRVGEMGWRTGSPALNVPAYEDVWADADAYLSAMRDMLTTARALLAPAGTIFLHLDCRTHAAMRLLMDELFGAENFVNEIVWAYQTGGRSLRYFSHKHDTILFYRKRPRYYFDITALPMPRGEHRSNHMRRAVDEQGRAYRAIRSGGREYRYYDDQPVYPSDVWQDISHLQQKDPERTGYDTQKPLKLLERIVLCASRPGDLVADLCFGSGTTLVAAAQLGRRFLGVDQGQAALAATRKRLLGFRADYRLGEGLRPTLLPAWRVTPNIGFYQVELCACAAQDPAGEGLSAAALDVVDQWSLGFLRQNTFVAMAGAARTRATPVLARALEVPMVSGALCACLVDLWGNSHHYVLEEAHG